MRAVPPSTTTITTSQPDAAATGANAATGASAAMGAIANGTTSDPSVGADAIQVYGIYALDIAARKDQLLLLFTYECA